MFTRLYIRRKFQKSASEYICVLIIMTISMILINIPSIFIDSINKGEAIRVYERTGGYDMVLHGGEQSDIQYFDEVNGITAVCENDNIYIVIDKSVDKDYTMNHISNIVNTNNLDISVEGYKYSNTAPPQLIILANIVSVVFTVVGMISIYFAYILMFVSRRNDLKTLTKIGISKRTLFQTLVAEISIIYAFSLLISIFVSNLAIKIIIDNYFRSSDYYIMIVYDYSIGSTVLLLVCSLLATVFAFALSWKKIASGLYGDYFENEKYHCRYIFSNIDNGKISDKRLIIATSLVRRSEYTVPCGIITVITVLLAAFMFHVVGLISDDYTNTDLTIQANTAQLYSHADEITKAYRKLYELPYVKNIDLRADDTGYTTILNTEKNLYTVYDTFNNVKYSHVVLMVSDSIDEHKLEKNEALVADGTDMSLFDGNILPLYAIHDLEHSGKQISASAELKIVGTVKKNINSNFLNVYVSAETFSHLTGHNPIPRIAYVQLNDDCDINKVLSEVSEIFETTSLFRITDNYSVRQEQQSNDRVIKGIITIMAFVITVCGTLLIYVFSSFIALKNANTNKTLLKLGIEQNNLFFGTITAAFIRAIFAVIIGLLFCITATSLITYSIRLDTSFKIGIAVYDIILVFAVVFVHVIPIFASVKKAINGGLK